MSVFLNQGWLKQCVGGALLASLVIFSGCGGGGSDSPVSSAPAPIPEPPILPAPPVVVTAAVEGRVVSSATGLPISGAVVNTGAVSATTGIDGRYQLTNVPASPRVVMNVRAANFAPGVTITEVFAGGASSVSTRLIPIAATATIANLSGGIVNLPNSPARVTFPGNAFGTITGNITVALTAVSPGQDPGTMPGDYTIDAGNGRLESFGAVIITATDAAGAPVNLAAGRTATIRIPVSSRGAIEQSMGLFSLDSITGSWVRDGTATLQGVLPNQFYEAVITRLATWNADKPIETSTVSGCVVDAQGARVPMVNITSDGVNYSGTSEARSDVNGTFTVAIKRGAIATITGSQAGTLLTNTVSSGPNSANSSLAQCLTLAPASNVVSIKLTWGQSPSDVDSNLIAPNGAYVYFGSRGSLTSAPFANLDVDDTSSFGPEVVTINRLMVGTYRYGVNNYSETTNPGLTNSPIRVELNTGGNLRIFTAPPGETSATTYLSLFNFTVDSRCNVVVTPINSWSTTVDIGSSTTTAPVYCSAQ